MWPLARSTCLLNASFQPARADPLSRHHARDLPAFGTEPDDFGREKSMANLSVETPRHDGSRINDYVVEAARSKSLECC
jgi:hypothetical protein